MATDELKATIQSSVQKQFLKIQNAYSKMVMDLRPIIFQEAVEFLLNQIQNVVKSLTKSHHAIINDFLDLRKDHIKLIK